ncbi:hypothetical protein B0H14DRAFT_2582333 [Mycena olivaceomarginata]|nr:hypothetical protein B0H14DRAFT_2582333 [Mycena olivaceomarginata]
MAAYIRYCKKCCKEKKVTSQYWKAKFSGTGIKVNAKCRECSEKDSVNLREKHGSSKPEKENEDLADDASDFIGVAAVNVDTFLDALSAAGDIKMFSALVDVSALGKEDIRDATDNVAELVWERIGYRFHYQSSREFRNSSTTRYE